MRRFMVAMRASVDMEQRLILYLSITKVALKIGPDQVEKLYTIAC